MFLFAILAILLWFFFLRKDVPITIKTINKDVRNKTLALLLLPIGTAIFILLNTSSIDYSVIGFLFITSFFIAIYEEVLFRAIGLGSFLSSGISPGKAIFQNQNIL